MEFKAASHSAANTPTTDPLLPVLCIHDTSVPQDRQTCVLKATKEAKVWHSSRPSIIDDDSRLRDPRTACEEAKEKCLLITQNPTEKQYLGQLIIPFGKYSGKRFKWLIENDVGYLKYILDCHIKGSRHPERKGPIQAEWGKDYLHRYVELFPSASCHLEINVDRAIYRQGRFRSFTFQEMWQWYSLHKCLHVDPQAGSDHERKMSQEAFCSVRQWLVMKEDDISSKSLKRFRLYILNKEKEKSPAATATSSTSGSRGYDDQADDALLAEALTTFESQGDTDLIPPYAASHLQPPQPSQTEAIPPSPGPLSAPAGQKGTESDVTEAAVAATPCEVTYEGWHKMWESGPHGLPEADVRWLKEDAERGIFQRQMLFVDKHGNNRKRIVRKSL